MIRLNNVTKFYQTGGDVVRALDGVSLEIQPGEFVAVSGPSGCGKSTLLSLAGGLAFPTSGVVAVDGREISSMSSTEQAHFRGETIGFVFQLFHLLPYLTVLENVLNAARPGQGAVDAEARRLLEQFELGNRLNHRPGQLSVGQRQRVALARALLNKPKVLLADEPTGNLDPDNAGAVLDYLAKFHQDGGTILLVTHDQSAAARADRTITLKAGKVAVATAQTP